MALRLIASLLLLSASIPISTLATSVAADDTDNDKAALLAFKAAAAINHGIDPLPSWNTTTTGDDALTTGEWWR
uniref:Leucine-rich repeat-containing N-terminal plant-type domain-containing protein n=1 Tax=Leersia perrieri TaxID=77586 RepID=A0A0D9VEP6_9ORYZ